MILQVDVQWATVTVNQNKIYEYEKLFINRL